MLGRDVDADQPCCCRNDGQDGGKRCEVDDFVPARFCLPPVIDVMPALRLAPIADDATADQQQPSLPALDLAEHFCQEFNTVFGSDGGVVLSPVHRINVTEQVF